MKLHLICWVFVCFAISCTQLADLQFDTGKQQVVLNAVLDASNDTIWAALSWSKAVTDSFGLQSIDDAVIILSKNEELAGTFQFDQKGSYYLVYQPKSGDTYTVTAFVGADSVFGTTRMPPAPNVAIEYFREEYCRYFEAHITTNKDDAYNYWISAMNLTLINDTITERILIPWIDADHILLDEFNRLPGANYCSFTYSFDYYLRIKNSNEIRKETIPFTANGYGGNRWKELVLFSADMHYDRYIKSSILASKNEMLQSAAPLNASPVAVYSNVNNGLGLIGSMNSRSFILKY